MKITRTAVPNYWVLVDIKEQADSASLSSSWLSRESSISGYYGSKSARKVICHGRIKVYLVSFAEW